ncbi:MAG: hypothetical protein JXC32_01775 [Anaerolineae bacterium]|nr:hypothetical protein [Anaerolineae bacterium]
MIDEKQSPKRHNWLVPATLVFVGVIFGSHYARFPLALAWKALEAVPLVPWLERAMARSLTATYFGLYPLYLLFTSLPVYLALSALGLGLAIAALILVRPTPVGRIALWLCMLAVVGLPAARWYRPAVTVAGNQVVARVPTQPGLVGGVVKAVQSGTEVRRCDYTLLGWSEQDALYGKETCGTRERLWVYWPMSDRRLQTVDAVPAGLLQQEVSRQQLRDLGVASTVPLDDALRIVVREPGLASREGWWIAFVARHTYGPEDVVVLMQ